MNLRKFAITTLGLFASLAIANTQKVSIDAAKSTVKWEGGKVVGGNHSGAIAIKEGFLNVEKGNLVGGEFVFDLTKMTVEDIPASDPKNGYLLSHLQNEDFFHVYGDKERKKLVHPTSKFVIKSVKAEKAAQHTHVISGDLSIKGITKPLSFPAKVSIDAKNKVSAEALITVDRTLFDIKYGSGKFFQGLADKTIKDEFTVSTKLQSL